VGDDPIRQPHAPTDGTVQQQRSGGFVDQRDRLVGPLVGFQADTGCIEALVKARSSKKEEKKLLKSVPEATV